jgi:uncharacterized protein
MESVNMTFLSQQAKRLCFNHPPFQVFLGLAFLAGPACSEPSGEGSGISGGTTQAVEKASIETWLPLQVGGLAVEAQIALEPGEMRRGLMFRKSLEENRGMLFVYTEPQIMSFWMRNTPLPLDVGFFDAEGVLREIHRLFPFDETPVRSSGNGLQFALEMNQGWFARQGLKPGARLDPALLRKALQARGADPVRFGLKP